MEGNEILVYVFRGFLESGKTSLIQGTIQNPGFSEGEKTLLICCEEGEVEYRQEILEKHNTILVYVDEQEDLTTELLEKWQKMYQPTRVMIEYNGTWETESLFEMEMPEYWMIVQVLTTIDASSFEMYMNNMGNLLVQQFREADAVIFNRCTEDTPKASYRRRVKAVSAKAQIIFEREDGTLDNIFEEEMPFDIHADIIHIEEEDYGIWYMDALENAKKYSGKKVQFKALVYHPDNFPKHWFVPGRFAMTCCADDVTFIGYKCKSEHVSSFPDRSWVYVTAEVRIEYAKEYGGKGVVLYATQIEEAERAKDELVYFT